MQYSKQSYNRCHTVDGSSSSSQLNGKIFSSTSATEVVQQSQIQHSSSNGSSKTDSSRDSGTSSPQPNEIKFLQLSSMKNNKMSINIEYADRKLSVNGHDVNHSHHHHMDDDEDSDSNDSVFSTGSSMDDEMLIDEPKKREARDIYLGGSCALRTNWRQDIAIPYLKSKNISYYMPTLHENLSKKQLDRRNSRTRGDKMEEEESEEEDFEKENGPLIYNPNILDSSRVLLFVISNETRSLAPMTLAAHYIGLGYNVVLCVQMLQDGCTIGNDKVRIFF